MKKVIVTTSSATLLLLLATLTLLAAMSDSQALKKGQSIFGPKFAMGQRRGTSDSNWWKVIGIDTPGCAEPSIVTGEGSVTWDAAFANWDMKAPMKHYNREPIYGPFKGNVPMHMIFTDDKAVAEASFIVDGVEKNLSTLGLDPAPRWDIIWPFDTTTLTPAPAIHTLCKTVKDQNGNTGITAAILFTVDQAAGFSNQWDVATAAFRWDPPNVPTGFSAAFTKDSGVDHVGHGGELTPSGTNDWKISVAGLKATPRFVRITNASGGVWENPKSDHSFIEIAWPPAGPGATADLYFEPFNEPAGLKLEITYPDGQKDIARF